jgi:hypothetical protein
MTNSFGAARRVDIERFDRSHWSVRITSVLVNHASRVRFVCSEDLLIVGLFLWLATLHFVAALRGRAPSAGVARRVPSVHGPRRRTAVHAAHTMMKPEGLPSTTSPRQPQ